MPPVAFHTPTLEKYQWGPVSAMITNTRQKNNSILRLLCIAITCICLLHDGKEIFSLSNHFHDSHKTRIELLVKDLIPAYLKLVGHLSHLESNNESISSHPGNNLLHRSIFFIAANRLVEPCPMCHQVCSLLHHIISILHKSNTWHQSTDDDPLS